MAEIPEHLLKRSQARKAALSGDAPANAQGNTEGGNGDATQAATPAGNAPAPAAPIGSAKAGAPNITGPKQLPPLKNRIPWYVMPVIVFLPVWALFYFGSLRSTVPVAAVDPKVLGAQIFAKNCSGCHGTTGEGGALDPKIGRKIPPQLSGGEVLKTFPTRDDHIKWVEGGSGSVGPGNPYGDPAREGGQHLSQGGMPAFQGVLTDAQIQAVVDYERDGLK